MRIVPALTYISAFAVASSIFSGCGSGKSVSETPEVQSSEKEGISAVNSEGEKLNASAKKEAIVTPHATAEKEESK